MIAHLSEASFHQDRTRARNWRKAASAAAAAKRGGLTVYRGPVITAGGNVHYNSVGNKRPGPAKDAKRKRPKVTGVSYIFSNSHCYLVTLLTLTRRGKTSLRSRQSSCSTMATATAKETKVVTLAVPCPPKITTLARPSMGFNLPTRTCGRRLNSSIQQRSLRM